MKLKYKLSKLAIEDIDSIWNYTANQWSTNQANKYFERIFEVIDSISINPNIGKSIKEVKENHRSVLVKSHIIVYKVENEIILIDRILHQKMAIENKLIE